MKGQRRHKADNRAGCLCRHHREVGVAELLRGREAIESAREPYELAMGGELVKRRRMDASAECLTGTQRATPLPERGERLLDISRASHSDNNSAISMFVASFLSGLRGHWPWCHGKRDRFRRPAGRRRGTPPGGPVR